MTIRTRRLGGASGIVGEAATFRSGDQGDSHQGEDYARPLDSRQALTEHSMRERDGERRVHGATDRDHGKHPLGRGHGEKRAGEHIEEPDREQDRD